MKNNAEIHPSLGLHAYKQKACDALTVAHRDMVGFQKLARGGAQVVADLNEATKRYQDARSVISELWLCAKDPEFIRMMEKAARRAGL